ncbi:MAG TPA: V-type ATP synthase subunit D, partial [Candidatus Saccharicenans sp.]|nr:V-type ATP synthase subunit D [Candidatus Saccharicenans sp.]
MKLKVNPNRMELMRLRRRLTLAQRGHKLLKDKLEELMRNFLEAARQFNRIKEEVDQEFRIITRSMAMVRVTQAQAELSGLIKDGELQLEVKTGR